jgi:transposase
MLRRKLSNDQWKRVAPVMRGKVGDRGRSDGNNREFIEALLWIDHTASPLRDLPIEFGRWNSIYVRFTRCIRQRCLANDFCGLRQDADFNEVFIDGTGIRAHQNAAGSAKKRRPKHSTALEEVSAPKSTPFLTTRVI